MRPSWTRAWLATLVILIAAAAIARNRHAELVEVEQRVLDWLLEDTDTTFWDAANALGAPALAWIAVAVMSLVTLKFDRMVAAVFPLTMAFGVGVALATRALVERPRPASASAATTSFPSLTVVYAGLWLGLMVLLLWWFGIPRLVWQIATEAAIVLVLATAIAQIVGGEHWPSDTVGSAVVMTFALIGSAVVLESRSRPKELFRRPERESEPAAIG